MKDKRIEEIEELAQVEGIPLPMPARMVVWFEDRGCIVDLITGIASRPESFTPTPMGRTIAHLLADAVGEVTL
jgi:hypothetical protein